MLVEKNPENKYSDRAITDELRGFIKDMANTSIMYGVLEESRRCNWLITYKPAARRSNVPMLIFQEVYGNLANEKIR